MITVCLQNLKKYIYDVIFCNLITIDLISKAATIFKLKLFKLNILFPQSEAFVVLNESVALE